MKLKAKSYLVDTHSHLDDKQFDTDREEVISRAFSSGVEKIINIGAGLGSSRRSADLAKRHENVYAAVGLHPHYFMKHEAWNTEHKNELEELAKSEKVVAIGEVGLEYYFKDKKFSAEEIKNSKEKQKEGFLYQIDLAIRRDLPLVIHCREAYKETLEILSEAKKAHGGKLRGVIHSYLGRSSYAGEFVKLGFLLSFNGIITYASDYGKIVKNTNLENILIETDCPYLTPEPHRGERNEPVYVRYVAEKIAEIKNISIEDVEKVTADNAEKLFGI